MDRSERLTEAELEEIRKRDKYARANIVYPTGKAYEVASADRAALLAEVDALRAAIRQHRDERGDDRCVADDGRLYAVLPEGDTRPERETLVTIENCQRYIECRQTGREYISPQRRIEELEAEAAELRAALTAAEAEARLLREEINQTTKGA